ncbi:hypothetical protein V8J36_09715 [Frigidibacter sp. MR17.14]|uniref:hypothetical protein n=1 Tax=Frigidibacter sp. MR17.14 TaxID=3126509 RepID=UPI003012B42C
MAGRHRLRVAGAEVEIDLGRGVLTDLAFSFGDRVIRPLHRAHWVGGPVPEGLAPVEAGLEGDFLSAPFGRDDIAPGGPIHGPAANSRWQVLHEAPGLLELELVAPVRGARIVKRLRLGSGALVTEHEIRGGAGHLSLAHHPMLRFSAPGWLSYSAKRAVLTGQGVEPGRHRLAVAARGTDLRAVPGVAGPCDLTRWPWEAEVGAGHEDFCTLVEAPGAALGWTAAVRPDEDDLVLILKDPATLPVTMLWLSNGGRDRAPWDGRHLGVIGIEDACTAGDEGNRAAASGRNRVAAEGVATALPLGEGVLHRTWHAICALPRPAGWERLASVAPAPGGVTLTSEGGEQRAVTLPV